MEDPYDPLDAYRSRLKEAHRKNVAEAFASLAAEAGVDVAANAAACREIGRLERELAEWRRRRGWRAFFEGVLWALVAACAVAAAAGVLADAAPGAAVLGLAVGALAGLVLWRWAHPASARAKERVAELSDRLGQAVAVAEAQMAALNARFDWDLPGKLFSKTVPDVKFDPYCSEGRLDDLRETYGWKGEGFGAGSVLWAQTGEINGNPFAVGRVLEQGMGTRTYRGHLRISWRERVGDSWQTRYQTLTATVEKPIPVHSEKTFLLYANEAAERLEFTRKPSPMASLEPGSGAERRAVGRCIRKLEKFARNLDDRYGFTMGDPEFEAYFQAWNRNDEVQFRLLYTALAQRRTLALLKDRREGFGDDFGMEKRGKINVVRPAHLGGAELDGDPARYRSHDFEKSRAMFQAANEAWFRHVYFAMAPLLAIPLYRQLRARAAIWGNAASATPEHEALANYLGEKRFRHPASATRNLLKTRVKGRAGGGRIVEVAAHGFRTEERVDVVPVWGGDGRLHDVEVPWLDYLPVVRRSDIRVVDAPGRSRLECEAAAASGGDMAGLVYRRAVLGG